MAFIGIKQTDGPLLLLFSVEKPAPKRATFGQAGPTNSVRGSRGHISESVPGKSHSDPSTLRLPPASRRTSWSPHSTSAHDVRSSTNGSCQRSFGRRILRILDIFRSRRRKYRL